MKKFSKQINERLKLTKDSQLQTNNISGLIFDDIKDDISVKCCTISLTNNTDFALNNAQTNLKYNLVFVNKSKSFNDIYKIIAHWAGDGIKEYNFNLYYYSDIKSSFLFFVNEYHNTLFILFNTKDNAKSFIKDYDLYKNEIANIFNELNIKYT